MLKTWARLKIDLALIDIVMPKITGAELALHQAISARRCRSFFMSAYSENAELCLERFREVIFLATPFTSMVLAEKVRQILDMPRSASAAS